MRFTDFAIQTRIPIILKWNETPKPSSSTPYVPVHVPRAPTDPTKRECSEVKEITRQKNLDHRTQPKPKSRISITPSNQHTQPKLNSRLETTPEIASRNVNDSTEKEAGDLGKECEEEEGDEGKESENEEKKRDEGDEDNKVESYEQHITTDTKQGLVCKHVRKYPVTRGKDFLWEI